MRPLIIFIAALCFAHSSYAVSNRVIDDLAELKKIGIEFEFDADFSDGAVGLYVIAPTELDLRKESGGIKPFSSISYLQTLGEVEHGPRLIGAPASHFPLAHWKLEDGRRQAWIKVLPQNVTNGYLAVSFVREKKDWPMIVHIPMPELVKQLKVEDEKRKAKEDAEARAKEKAEAKAPKPELGVKQGDRKAAAQPGEPPRFVVRVDGKEGFIDPEGNIVIPPTFQKAYPFREGLAAVQVHGRWGFIDANGDMVIAPRFVQTGFFSEGLAAFRQPYRQLWGAWGYIDRQGEVVVEPRFDTAEEFRGGVARVGLETGRGKLLAFVADARLVPLDYRFIDRAGAEVEDPGPTRFATGAPGERIFFKQGEKFGYVDAGGRVVIEAQFAAANAFSDGLACVRQEDLYGFIGEDGKFVIPPGFQYPNDFSEGLAGVPLGDEGWGFIDKDGKTVIPPKFGWVYGSYRHGIVEVTSDGKAGYIDKQGEWVWPPSE